VTGVYFTSITLANGTTGVLVPGTPVTYGGTRVLCWLQLQTPAATVSLKEFTGQNGAN
jgi:hypothetical protein